MDPTPHILKDEIGLRLVAPDENWRQRPDMHLHGTRGYRASIVARARFIEDLVEEKLKESISQYVILGAGLDTFAQRKPELLSKLHVFEIDKPDTQAWKLQRLDDTGFAISQNHEFVSVDFEAGESWRAKLKAHGFKEERPAVVASAGVSMYLSRDANFDTLSQIAVLAPDTVLAMTFMLPPELVEPEERAPYEMILERTRAAGTPFLSLFRAKEALDLAREAGFQNVQHVSKNDLVKKYFVNRADGLLPASGEEFLVATVEH